MFQLRIQVYCWAYQQTCKIELELIIITIAAFCSEKLVFKNSFIFKAKKKLFMSPVSGPTQLKGADADIQKKKKIFIFYSLSL